MAELTDNDRKEIWSEFMSKVCSRQETFTANFTKEQLRTCVNEIDGWINDNVASFKSSISEPLKSGLTGKQLVELFMLVAGKRWEVI